MKIYFAKAMEKFMRDQERRPLHSEPTSRPNPNYTVFGVGMPDTDMESADSHGSRGNTFDPDDLDIDGVRRPHLATTEAIMREGFAAQRISMPAIADLKEFSGRYHDDYRARSWVRKVKSAFLRDQAPDSEKCLIFEDLPTSQHETGTPS
uniref:Uncharacterized protein n=1 Tax=Peronospora matthiolae TaxID=2874970 RepID=A0AAV1UPS4_9STRA